MIQPTAPLGTIKAILAIAVKFIVIVLSGIAITNGSVFASSTENTECPLPASSLVEALSNICEKSNQLTVRYGDPVECGATMSIDDDISLAPTVTYPAAIEDTNYVLVMVDPDAPGSSLSELKFFLHWLVIDIKGKQLIEGKGFSLNGGVGYLPPSPPGETHVYKFVLFEIADQKQITTGTNGNRVRFSLKDFVTDSDICTLISVFEFYVKG